MIDKGKAVTYNEKARRRGESVLVLLQRGAHIENFIV